MKINCIHTVYTGEGIDILYLFHGMFRALKNTTAMPQS